MESRPSSMWTILECHLSPVWIPKTAQYQVAVRLWLFRGGQCWQGRLKYKSHPQTHWFHALICTCVATKATSNHAFLSFFLASSFEISSKRTLLHSECSLGSIGRFGWIWVNFQHLTKNLVTDSREVIEVCGHSSWLIDRVWNNVNPTFHSSH